MVKTSFTHTVLAVAFCIACWPKPAAAQDNLWTGGVGGNWNNTTWNQGGAPDASLDDRAIIGSTADLTASIIGGTSITSAVQSPTIVLGNGSGTSGTLTITPSGSLTVVPGAGGSFEGLGNVDVGLSNGTGVLNVQGTLIADRLATDTSGNVESSIVLSGSASVTIGEGFLDHRLRIESPNVNFNVLGGANTSGELILGAAGTHTWVISAAGHSTISVQGNADLGGTLNVEFSGVTPGVSSTYDLINAATIDALDPAPTSFSKVVTNVDHTLAVGEVFAVQNVAGGSGAIARLGREQRPVLVVDRQTGAMSIDNPGTRTSIAIDVYEVRSSTFGALNPNAWTSIAPANGWQEANPSSKAISEINPLGSVSFAAGSSTPLGNVFVAPSPASFGVETEDLVFRYSKPGSGYTLGDVIYTGLPNNTLTLNVDPETGEAQIVNGTGFTVAIDNYNITSPSGSLLSDNANWSSLADGSSDWFEANASAQQLAELKVDGGLTIAPNSVINLGTPFDDVNGRQDLGFTFAVVNNFAGDFNDDGRVDAADYTVWRDNLGAVEDGDVLAGNGNGGIVDNTDYQLWRSHFGAVGVNGGDRFITGKVLYGSLLSIGSGSLQRATAVPEPCSLLMAFVAASVVAGTAGRKRRNCIDCQELYMSTSTERVQGGPR